MISLKTKSIQQPMTDFLNLNGAQDEWLNRCTGTWFNNKELQNLSLWQRLNSFMAIIISDIWSLSIKGKLEPLARNFNFLKVIMQGKLFQRCMNFLYCSVLSLGGKVNTRRMVTAWHGIHFHKNNLWNILVIGNYYVNFQSFQN